jgi:hypothetical protein
MTPRFQLPTNCQRRESCKNLVGILRESWFKTGENDMSKKKESWKKPETHGVSDEPNHRENKDRDAPVVEPPALRPKRPNFRKERTKK